MDAFGDDFTAVNDVDPAAEFLAREHDQLAGLEDLIPEVSQTQPIESVQGGQSWFILFKNNWHFVSYLLHTLRIMNGI